MKGERYEPNTRLKALRESRGMTQEALAYKLGTRGFAVSQWERGQTKLSIEEARKVAFHLRAGKVSDVLMPEDGRPAKAAKGETAAKAVAS